MPKYYTTFLFRGVTNPRTLHCTHKYLGELNAQDLNLVEYLLAEYFQIPRRAPLWLFTIEDFFGPQKDIRVLKVPPFFTDPLASLREKLSKIRKDDYPYTPHVTTGTREFLDIKMDRYALVSNEEGVKWSIALE